jgi:hypothetical protein
MPTRPAATRVLTGSLCESASLKCLSAASARLSAIAASHRSDGLGFDLEYFFLYLLAQLALEFLKVRLPVRCNKASDQVWTTMPLRVDWLVTSKHQRDSANEQIGVMMGSIKCLQRKHAYQGSSVIDVPPTLIVLCTQFTRSCRDSRITAWPAAVACMHQSESSRPSVFS